MKFSLFSTGVLLFAFQAAFGANEPRPILASAMTIGNSIVVAVGNENNTEVSTVFVLQGGQGLNRDFSIGRIVVDKKHLILWPTDSMDKPLVFTLGESPEYLKHLNDQEQAQAEIFKGFGLTRYAKSSWSGSYAQSVNDLREGKYSEIITE